MKRKPLSISRRAIVLFLFCSMIFPFTGCRSQSKLPRVKNAEDAISVLKDIGKDYGYENALSELTELRTNTVNGDSYYRLQQHYEGIPVYGRTAVCFTDEKGNVEYVTGNATDINADMDLTPTASKEDIHASVRDFLLKKYEGTEIAEEAQMYTQDLCIYSMDADSNSRLAYCINIGLNEIILDAHSAKILYSKEIVDEFTGYMASDSNKTNGFPISKSEDGTYYLADEENKWYVWDLQGHSTWSIKGHGTDLDDGQLLISEDEIFGNTTLEAGYEDGAKLFLNAIKANAYFETNFSFKLDKLYLFYNEGLSKALGGGCFDADKNYSGYLILGKKTGVDDYDIFGHEFGHVVSKYYINWANNSLENLALKEALSDIWGEIIETYVFMSSTTPDWIMQGDNISVRRSLSDPKDTGTASHADEKPPMLSLLEEQYFFSTVISHTAYLMWNGMDGSLDKKIDVDHLAELWYRAMLMMPSDCDFQECRKLVELAARSMDLTEAQVTCVSEAFTTVGIAKKTSYDEISEDAVLLLTGINDKPYGNYTLYIKPVDIQEEAAELVNADANRIKENCQDIRTVTSAEPYPLELKRGVYAVAVEDNADRTKCFAKLFWVTKEGNDTVSIETNFGIKRLTQIVEYWDDAKTTISLHYDDQTGLLDSVTASYDHNEERRNVVYHYTYDSNRRLVRVESGDIDYDFYNYALLELSYDSESRVSSWNMFSPLDFYYSGTCRYDASGRMVSAETSRTTITLSYDQDGNLTETKTVNPDRPDYFEPVTNKSFYFDEEGRVSRTVDLSPSTLELYENGLAESYDYLYYPFIIITGEHYTYGYPNLECLGIDCLNTVNGSLWYDLMSYITHPLSLSLDGVDTFTKDTDGYLITIEGTTDNGRAKVRYDFTYDNGQEAVDLMDIDFSVIGAAMNEAAGFAWNWFWDTKEIDHSDSISIDANINDGKLHLYATTAAGIHCEEDLRELSHNYFTYDVVDELMTYKTFVEQNNKLYISEPLGLGGIAPDSLYIQVTKVNDADFEITVYEMYDQGTPYETLSEPRTIHYLKEDGCWVFDSVLCNMGVSVPVYPYGQ